MTTPDLPEDEERDASLPSGIEWAAAGTSGVLTLAMTGNPVAAGLPLLAPAFKAAHALDRRSSEKRALRAARTLQAAADELGCSIEELSEQVVSSDARTELLARVLEASSRTINLAAKVEALGRVLAAGLQDDAKFDESVLLAAALQELEKTHVEILLHIFRNPQAIPGGPGPEWQTPGPAKAFPGLAHVMDSLLGVLARHALIGDVASHTAFFDGGSPVWHITDLGQQMLELLIKEGEPR